MIALTSRETTIGLLACPPPPVVRCFRRMIDDREGAPAVAVLSYAAWQARFARDRAFSVAR